MVFSANLFRKVKLLFANIPIVTDHITYVVFLQVCADGDRVRLLESPGLGDGNSRGTQSGETGRTGREERDDYRGAAGTSSQEDDPSTRWVTDIPAARDCHQQNVEAIQVKTT